MADQQGQHGATSSLEAMCSGLGTDFDITDLTPDQCPDKQVSEPLFSALFGDAGQVLKGQSQCARASYA